MNMPVGCVSNMSCISFLVMSGRYHALDRRLRWVFALNVVSLGSVYGSNRKRRRTYDLESDGTYEDRGVGVARKVRANAHTNTHLYD